MKLSRNSISKESISQFNLWLDDRPYDKFKFYFSDHDVEFQYMVDKFIAQNEDLCRIIPHNAYLVTRCVKTAAKKMGFCGHFDNYRTTILIPLMIPDTEENGDLLVWQNARPEPKNLFKHIVSKVWFQLFLAKVFFGSIRRHFERIRVDVGDALTFNGFVNMHCNMYLIGERRSLLIHFDKPFSNSKFVAMTENLSQFWARD